MNSFESPLIVTRPAPDHRKLMARIAEAGNPAIHCPAFEIEPVPKPVLGDRLARLQGFDAVIVTSPVAARLIAAEGDNPRMRNIRFLAPGKGTASVLRAVGLQCRFPDSGGTSEHILAMPDLDGVDGRRVAVVGAPDGRGLLASALSERGASVEKVHVYLRKPLAPVPALIDALRRRLDPVVLISSRQALDMITAALDEELRPAWLNLRFVVSSRRLERACRDAGIPRIRRADGAADEQMLVAASQAGWIMAHPGSTRADDFR